MSRNAIRTACRWAPAIAPAFLAAACAAACACDHALDRALAKRAGAFRVATFNVALFGSRAGELLARLENGADQQARAVAAIIQQVDPDALLINELDFDPAGHVLSVFMARYLAVAQDLPSSVGRCRGVRFPYRLAAPVNTGVASGFDLDRDGTVGRSVGSDEYARDAWGYGRYPGQYGMAILSKFPLETGAIRTFQHFRWQDMPGALLPEQPGGEPWYGREILQRLPLSSKSHWDVPVVIDTLRIHLLASHPTPPVFDGLEDANGRRNHDEIRFWADYLSADSSAYIVDDQGQRGGLPCNAQFVVLGDLNSDPADGDDPRYAVRQLLGNPRIFAGFTPRSMGGLEQAGLQRGANAAHRGDPAADTSELPDRDGPGNLRLDYVLPSRGLRVVGGGVYWPRKSDPRFALVGAGAPIASSDHRLVWIDLMIGQPAKN